MFVIVTYPWPVASAHVELSGYRRAGSAWYESDSVEDAVERPEQRIDELVAWTGPERLRLRWYRLRLAIRDSRSASRKAGEPPQRVL